MKKPSVWRDFNWDTSTGLGSFQAHPFSLMGRLRANQSYNMWHGVPAELCMWKGKPIDDCPNVHRTEIELFPEFNLKR